MLRIITFILAIYCCISTASGATFSVTNLNNSGTGSFRQAIMDANAASGATAASPHIINFTLSGQIDLLSILPDINNHMTINGDISGNTINRSSGGDYRILNVIGAKKVTLNNLIIQNGRAGSGTRGGGMRISVDGTHVTCNNCVFQNNFSTSAGGGIAIEGSTALILVLNNCTVIGNTSVEDGGGIHNRGGTLTAVNCTIANNTHNHPHGGSGLDALFVSVTTLINCTITGNHSTQATGASGASFDNVLHMTNTIIAGNTGGETQFMVNTCCVPFIGGTNLNNLVTACLAINGSTCPTFAFTSNPNLGALTTCGLQSYFPLNSGSIAINAGTTTGAPTTDICGNARTGNPDLGSAEAPSCPDADGDGFTAASCGGTDCNDNNTAINPGAAEACDGVDNNCNGLTDDGLPFVTYYNDADGDGYGTGSGQSLCSNPGQGFATQAGDCNNNNAAVKPGAMEVCDGVDNNCDGTIDNVLSGDGAWQNANVGTANGNATFPPCDAKSNDVFTIQASGFSTSSSDKLHLVSQQLCGNVELIARVTGVTNGGWAGITLRETLAPGSKKVALKTQLSTNIRREIRTATNGAVNTLNFFRPLDTWLRLVRTGSNFAGYTSIDGSSWTFAFSATVSMNGCIYVGVFAESINTNVMTTASFDHVQITGGSQPLIQGPQTPVAASDASVKVYPNPTNGEVNVYFANAPTSLVRIQVFNTLGESILLKQTDGSGMVTELLDLSDLDDGVYFITVQAAGYAPLTKRVVLAK